MSVSGGRKRKTLILEGNPNGETLEEQVDAPEDRLIHAIEISADKSGGSQDGECFIKVGSDPWNDPSAGASAQNDAEQLAVTMSAHSDETNGQMDIPHVYEEYDPPFEWNEGQTLTAEFIETIGNQSMDFEAAVHYSEA